MAQRLSVRALVLLSCAVLLGGCGEGKREAGSDNAEKNVNKQQSEVEYVRQRYPQSDAIEKEAELAAQRLTERLTAAEPLYHIMLMAPASAGSMVALQAVATPLPVADFRARMVVVEPSAQVENLSTLERARARAAAFGLDWAKQRNHTELVYMLHRKSPKSGCSSSKSKEDYKFSSDAVVVTGKRSGYSGAGQEPFSIALHYLGSRDGKDHYLLSFTVEEGVASGRPAGQEAGADWRSTEHRTDPLDLFTEVKTITYADGSTEVTRTRRISYELVYDGEPFYLKLADRALLCFGGYGIERYTAEEQVAMQGKRSSELYDLYRPCPNCALSDAMGVDEIRVEVGAFAAF